MPILKSLFRDRYNVSQERLKICSTCPYYENMIGRCQKCGCFMEFKTLMMEASCPIGKWKDNKEEEDKCEY